MVPGHWPWRSRQPNPWLALTVAVPYLVIVVAMGYTRQGVAIGRSMLGLVALEQAKFFRFLFWISFACTFHKSAVILLPLAFFSRSRQRFITILGVLVVGILVFFLFLQESLGHIFAGYLDDGMKSSGALIRVMMNAVPALFFLVFRKRFHLTISAQSFWTWISTSALIFIPALALSPSSTAVDRVALYWIPLQVYVWSRLPMALSFGPRSEHFILQTIILYGLLVLLIWLMLGVHAFAWLPYKFYPWEVIMSNLFPYM